MGPYFSMTLQFEHKRLKPTFVEELYSKIISCGFGFKSGFWFHGNAKLDEIIKWNQKLLEKGFKLGYKQYVKHDYMQILFNSEVYSEFRGYWMYSENQITFNIIIPEFDIINYDTFIDEKVFPVKQLALEIWKSNIVDSIQTSVEFDFGYASLSEISDGKDISVHPFAILKEDDYKRFSEDYFNTYLITEVCNDGILVENNGKITHGF